MTPEKAHFYPEQNTIREAVGVFKNADSLQAAIDDLQHAGFARREISVLAHEQTVEKELGHMYQRVEEVVDDPDVPRTVFIPNETLGEAEGALLSLPLYVAATSALGVVVASGGTVLAALTATIAAGSAGALIGGALASLLAKHHADYIQYQLDHGGLLLWINTDTPEKEKTAVEILKKHSAHDVHVHELPI